MDLHTGVRLTSGGQPSSYFTTSCLFNTHSNIPRPLLVGAALTTSSVHACRTPVPESLTEHRLIPDPNTTPLGAVDPRTAQPTKRSASSSLRVKASDEKATTISPPVLATGPTKASISRDLSRGPHPQKHELLTTEGRLGTPNITQNPMEAQASYEGREVSDDTGKSVHSAQVKSSVSARTSGQDQDDASRERTAGSPLVTGKDDKNTRYSAGTCARQATEERIAAGKEAASAQAVNRGHKVTMIEVPDQDDDVAYRRWLERGSPIFRPKRKSAGLPTPPDSPKMMSPPPNGGVGPTCVNKEEVTSPTVAEPSTASAKVKEVPHRWFRPFEVDWTLRAICEARNDNAARAALALWIHKDKGAALTDKLLIELRLGRENARKRLYELRDPPVIVQAHESSTNNFMVDIVLNPMTGTKTLSTRGLLDSGCTSSAINRSFVEKH